MSLPICYKRSISPPVYLSLLISQPQEEEYLSMVMKIIIIIVFIRILITFITVSFTSPSPYHPIPRIVSALYYSKHPFVSVSIKWSFKYHHSFLLLNKVTLLPLLPSSPLDTKKKKKHVKAQLLPI